MNFGNLTDFQINWLVLQIKSGKKPLNYPHNADGRSVGIRDVNDNYHWYDFCNDWADAGPIIAANLIGIKPVPLFVGGHRWFASKGEGYSVPKAADNNPLRAAMIVFLMTQEKENG